METPKLYKVVAPKDLYLSWNKALLPEDELKGWEEYKKQELVGRSDDEIRTIKMEPEILRLKRWCNAMGLGIDDSQEMFKKGEIPRLPVNYQTELKFKLPKGESYISERQYNELKKFEKKAIPQKLEPGQSKPIIHYEGFLVFTEVSEEEIEKK
jgi:hypothetical protein